MMHRPVLCPMGHKMEAFKTAGGGWRYGCTACGTRKGNGHYGWISPLRSTKDLAYMAAQKRPTPQEDDEKKVISNVERGNEG